MLKLLRRLAPCLALLGFLAPSWAQTLPAGVTKVRSVEGIDEYLSTMYVGIPSPF